MTILEKPIISNFRFTSNYYPDTTFTNLTLRNRVNAACSFGTRKVEFEDVPFSLNLTKVDKRNRAEVQFQTYSKDYNLHERLNSQAWNRVEIFLSLDTIDQLIDYLVRIKLHLEGTMKLG